MAGGPGHRCRVTGSLDLIKHGEHRQVHRQQDGFPRFRPWRWRWPPQSSRARASIRLPAGHQPGERLDHGADFVFVEVQGAEHRHLFWLSTSIIRSMTGSSVAVASFTQGSAGHLRPRGSWPMAIEALAKSKPLSRFTWLGDALGNGRVYSIGLACLHRWSLNVDAQDRCARRRSLFHGPGTWVMPGGCIRSGPPPWRC